MNISEFLKLYLIAVPVFFVIDIIWISQIALKYYRSQMGPLLSEKVNWPAAIVFYLVFIAGIVLFVLLPSIAEKSLSKAVLFGAAFGFVTYATYDLTSLATTRNWPFTLTFVDLAWGTFLTASVSTITYLIFTKLN